MSISNLEELLEKGVLWHPKGGGARSAASLSGGLIQVGAIHEFCCKGSFEAPLSILATFAVQACLSADQDKYTLWIGKACRPDPVFIRSLLPSESVFAKRFFSHSIFIDPPDEKNFLWSVEAALRSPAVTAVIAHFKSMSFSISRRLSISAKSAQTLGLFAVSPAVLHVPTAAATVWQIRPVVSPSAHPRFELSLVKRKGGPVPEAPWIYELVDNGETISFNIPADVVGQSGAAKADESQREKTDRIRRRA